jgi:hypothetical protein
MATNHTVGNYRNDKGYTSALVSEVPSEEPESTAFACI